MTDKIRVLIIEDDTDLQFLYNTAFTHSDFEVSQAETASQAVGHLNNYEYDVVVLDLNLPDAHGSVVVDHIEANFPHLMNKIIVITANDHWVGNLGTRGVKYILVKPVNIMDVTTMIRDLSN